MNYFILKNFDIYYHITFQKVDKILGSPTEKYANFQPLPPLTIKKKCVCVSFFRILKRVDLFFQFNWPFALILS